MPTPRHLRAAVPPAPDRPSPPTPAGLPAPDAARPNLAGDQTAVSVGASAHSLHPAGGPAGGPSLYPCVQCSSRMASASLFLTVPTRPASGLLGQLVRLTPSQQIGIAPAHPGARIPARTDA